MQWFRWYGWFLAVVVMLVPADGSAGTWRIGRNQTDCPGGCHWYDDHPEVIIDGSEIFVAMRSPSVVAGDTVRVWPGEYGTRFTLKSSVALVSDQGPDVTIMNGVGGQQPLCVMVAAGPSTTVDGFTIQWNSGVTGTGGGIAAYVSSGTIKNNIFRDCRAALGAGVYLQFCDLTLENNLFLDNVCESGGGIIAVTGGSPTIRNNTLVRSRAPAGLQGAALYASGSGMTFENNIITESIGGTAVYCAGPSTGVFGCNIMWQNLDGAFGGSCVDSVGASGNQNVDPLHCNPVTDDYGVCTDSPAVTGPCGAIGYQPPSGNCPDCFPTSVAAFEFETWGRVKSRYR